MGWPGNFLGAFPPTVSGSKAEVPNAKEESIPPCHESEGAAAGLMPASWWVVVSEIGTF